MYFNEFDAELDNLLKLSEGTLNIKHFGTLLKKTSKLHDSFCTAQVSLFKIL